MGCAPCAQRAKERRERMMAELSAFTGETPQEETTPVSSTYKETSVNSAYAEFKKKMQGYNSQALYNSNNQ